MNFIFVPDGVASEVLLMLDDIAHQPVVGGFVIADADWREQLDIDCLAVLSDSQFLRTSKLAMTSIFISAELPSIKEKILSVLSGRRQRAFPNVIHLKYSVDYRHEEVKLGHGVILYPPASLTTDIEVGGFVEINPGATVAHECQTGHLSTLCSGSNILGDFRIGPRWFIKPGAIIREGIRIAADYIIGAGAVVVRSISETGNWARNPAGKLSVQCVF